VAEARKRILKGQAVFIDRLLEALRQCRSSGGD
jgi:predicted NUDIX family NTP pyrophosphohydrolase